MRDNDFTTTWLENNDLLNSQIIRNDGNTYKIFCGKSPKKHDFRRLNNIRDMKKNYNIPFKYIITYMTTK